MLQLRSVSGEPRFPSHLFLEQRSPPPPPPPPTLLSSGHPVPTPSPLPFTQPGPAFSQQGQQPVFPRERPVRPALQPPGPVGLLHFSQPGSAATRPFIPPRQPFLPGPGQPFLPTHTQPSLQVSGLWFRIQRTSSTFQTCKMLPLTCSHLLTYHRPRLVT